MAKVYMKLNSDIKEVELRAVRDNVRFLSKDNKIDIRWNHISDVFVVDWETFYTIYAEARGFFTKPFIVCDTEEVLDFICSRYCYE